MPSVTQRGLIRAAIVDVVRLAIPNCDITTGPRLSQITSTPKRLTFEVVGPSTKSVENLLIGGYVKQGQFWRWEINVMPPTRTSEDADAMADEIFETYLLPALVPEHPLPAFRPTEQCGDMTLVADPEESVYPAGYTQAGYIWTMAVVHPFFR